MRATWSLCLLPLALLAAVAAAPAPATAVAFTPAPVTLTKTSVKLLQGGAKRFYTHVAWTAVPGAQSYRWHKQILKDGHWTDTDQWDTSPAGKLFHDGYTDVGKGVSKTVRFKVRAKFAVGVSSDWAYSNKLTFTN